MHKAFGEGTVSRIEKRPTGNTYIYIMFGKTEKTFGFPGAFQDGFLTVKEA